jgi:DNA-binding MarR family transcriptional regulator
VKDKSFTYFGKGMVIIMETKYLIGREIRILSNLIKRRVGSSKVIAETDKLTGTHGYMIGYIYHNMDKGDIFQRDLEEEFSIRRSTATGILQLMEKNGLIIRESVDYDARLKKLVLTPKAIAVHEAVMKEFESIESLIARGLTQEEINMFFDIMNKIKQNIE